MQSIDDFFKEFEARSNSMKVNNGKKKKQKMKNKPLAAENELDFSEIVPPASKMAKVGKMLDGEDEAFAKFLKEEDPELLDFKDEDLQDSDGAESDLEDNKQSEFVADENDAEEIEEHDEPEDVVNRSLVNGVKKWTKLFEGNAANLSTCRSLMRSFVQVSNPMVAAFGSSKRNKINFDPRQTTEADDVLLDSIMNLASVYLKPTLCKFLGTKVADKRDMPYSDLPKWINIVNPLQKYFTSCIKLIEGAVQQKITYKILKHLLVMRNFLKCYPKTISQVIKVVSDCWADQTNHEVELSSFLLLERIAKMDLEQYHQEIARKAFSSYIKKSSASSLETLPKIAFMQQCLVQLFALDLNFTYKQAFDSVKAIVLLVKAVTIDKKKEAQPELCSWKTVHTLYLWASMYGSMKNYGILSSLVYPLVETIKEIVNYASGPRYYPLRFHCVDMLIMLAKSTGKFIPIFQHILDIFSQTDFNARPKKLSVRPFNLSGTVRFSENDLNEKGFLDCITERMYRLLLEVMNMHAYSIASPELFLMPIVHIRKFLKACENRDYLQKFKQLVEKMEENAQFIATEREKVTFSVHDADQIKKWEENMKNENKSPISKFYRRFIEIEAKNKAAANLTPGQEKTTKFSRKRNKFTKSPQNGGVSKKKGKKKALSKQS